MVGFIGNIGPWELIFILAIALIVVGPGKLPEVAKSLGKATRDFKKATSGIKEEFKETISFDEEPVRANIQKTADKSDSVQSDTAAKKTDDDTGKEDL
ncbi:MAG: twin-arginine translocase TatA/TatE family subunit [Syntrophomonadaceae bacterium]|nr:twin-arginine translocase TatA/TatE family subunit [Syntrophomonadaceae bacterium]MDD3889502.1 twin-arginine translocase TatA/TatE family subunit [Syntrophomonadaceae bacterium]MDD4548671.1 twin-arginine translocase TatA/TatE family subunit [Syntrophomonadaceae bacterium]